MQSFCATPSYYINVASRSFKMPSMHYHASYELYYLAAGSREYFVEDKLFSVAVGDFVLIPPKTLHRTGGEYAERILVNFTQEFLESVYTPQMAKQLTQCFCHMKITPDTARQGTCVELLKKLAANPPDSEAALLLGLLLLELSKCTTQEIEEDTVSAIVSYINKNYSTIFGIDQIVEAFFISKYHLCHIFKNAMKMTVIDYLNQIKIKNACQMLCFTQRDMGKIAQMCGYHSAAYFSSVFKKIMGMTPSRYREEYGQ